MTLVSLLIINKWHYLSLINEWWRISDLYEKFLSIDLEKYIIIFNHFNFGNRIKEWYKIINSWILKDFIKWLKNIISEKLILYINFKDKYREIEKKSLISFKRKKSLIFFKKKIINLFINIKNN